MVRGGKRPGAGRPEKNQNQLLKYVFRVTEPEKDFIEFSRIKKIDLAKLKKTLLTFFALLFFSMPVNALTLTGSVEYTVESARYEAFENIAYNIPKEEYSKFLNDLYTYSNISDIRAGRIHAGYYDTSRKLVPFYKGKFLIFYGVQYDSTPNKKYYYSTTGKLLKFDVSNFNGSYPYKSLSYDAKGNLKTVTFAMSDKEAYMYDSNKKFIGHWLNNQFYNAKGKKEITRRL